jgi:hypothetical protein
LYDADGKFGIRDSFNSSTILMQLNFDFTQRVFSYNYFTFADILSRIGGLQGSIMPLLGQLTPLFMLYFLVKLCEIIKEKLEESYLKDAAKFATLAGKQFQKILELLDKGQLNS